MGGALDVLVTLAVLEGVFEVAGGGGVDELVVAGAFTGWLSARCWLLRSITTATMIRATPHAQVCFSREHVEEFADFLRESGGFQIF